MGKWLIFIFGALGFCWQVIGSNKYDNYTLLKITPRNERQLEALVKFFKNKNGSEEVDIFKRSHGLHDATDVLVSPRKRHAIVKFANRHLMPIKLTNHYGRFLELKSKKKLKSSLRFNLFDYNSYDAMSRHIHYISKKRRKRVQLQTLGESYEGREMTLVKISANHKANNPIIFIDAGAHAREWAAPALAFYIIDRLANGPTHKLRGVDWYILPLVNPDGYEFSRMHPDVRHRMWRKSRSRTRKRGCYGVDINRNYDYQWAVSGVSLDPCDPQIFAGRKAFSERESRRVRNVMHEYSDRIKLYVSIHSYGNYLVYPWGYTGDELPSGWENLHKLAKMYSTTVENAGGKPLNVMSAGQWYPAAGGSDDYAFGVAKIPYAYTLEITDGHEFIFPSSLLNRVLPQYYEGFTTFAQHIRSEFRYKVNNLT